MLFGCRSGGSSTSEEQSLVATKTMTVSDLVLLLYLRLRVSLHGEVYILSGRSRKLRSHRHGFEICKSFELLESRIAEFQVRSGQALVKCLMTSEIKSIIKKLENEAKTIVN